MSISKIIDLNSTFKVFGCETSWPSFVFLLFCFVFTYLHLFTLPATPIFYEEDHLYILHDAWRMYKGEMIYRDFFQLTFPGTQLLYLLFFYVFGLRFWIVDVIILLQICVSVALCLALSKTIIGNNLYAYLPPALYLFFGVRWFGLDGNHRVFSPIFAYLGAYVLLKQRSGKRIMLAGGFCALSSFFTQQRGVLVACALALFLLGEGVVKRRPWRDTFRNEIILIGTFIGTLSALILPFVLLTGPGKFFDYTLFFISNYVRDPTANYQAFVIAAQSVFSQGYGITAVMLFYYALIPLVYAVTIIYLWFRRRDPDVGPKDRVLLLCLVGLVLSLGTFAPSVGRLFQVSVPALVMFGWLIYRLRPWADLPVKAAVAALILLGCVTALRTQAHWDKNVLQAPTGRIAFLSPVTMEKYEWLRTNASRDDTVFEVYQCAVNFPMLLDNPSQVTQLFNTGYTPEWQVTQTIENLEKKKARFVIWDANWNAELATMAEGERLNPLYRYLLRKYEMKQQFTPYGTRSPQIWERTD
jgi:hypothetical protein